MGEEANNGGYWRFDGESYIDFAGWFVLISCFIGRWEGKWAVWMRHVRMRRDVLWTCVRRRDCICDCCILGSWHMVRGKGWGGSYAQSTDTTCSKLSLFVVFQKTTEAVKDHISPCLTWMVVKSKWAVIMQRHSKMPILKCRYLHRESQVAVRTNSDPSHYQQHYNGETRQVS